MSLSHLVVDSPLGPITLVADRDALCGLYFEAHRSPHVHVGERSSPHAHPTLRMAADQIDEYFSGSRTSFDVPLRMHGTAFQLVVWSALREIPFGATASYGEVARLVGRPGSARAVGAANGSNPISVIVPCHRVIGAGGGLTGYGGGLTRKQALLDLERAHVAVSPPPAPRSESTVAPRLEESAHAGSSYASIP